MKFFQSFSARARRTVFLAHADALREGAQAITPEHILGALLKEDPALFALVTPERPNSAIELARLLTTDRAIQTTKKQSGERLSLSTPSKEVVFAASEVRKRLGHKAVGTQHLLLALLVTPSRPSSWFRRRETRTDSSAKQALLKYGISARAVEEKIAEGIVTPLTWVLDDSILKLNAQLSALVELLISKRVFKRSDFVALLDQNAEPTKPDAFLVPLIEALSQKGLISASEKESVLLLPNEPSSSVKTSETIFADAVTGATDESSLPPSAGVTPG
jgi:hypothetical protein